MTIPELMDGIRKLDMVLPEFQREYVWEREQAKQLMVSLFRSYPTGSLLFWNPGELPSGLTPEGLRIEHPSIPHNPLICDPMYLAHYIEKAGTGTLDMIARCLEAGLPEPSFEQRGGQFVTTLWRDWLTDAVMEQLVLNDRQRKGLVHVKTHGTMTNADYQRLAATTRPTAMRDLADLVNKGLLVRHGEGRGAHYVVAGRMTQK